MLNAHPHDNRTINDLVADILKLKGEHTKNSEDFQRRMEAISARLAELKARNVAALIVDLAENESAVFTLSVASTPEILPA